MEGLEIVMNLEKLEIYDVIDHDHPENNIKETPDTDNEYCHEARARNLKTSRNYSERGRALLSGPPYYLPYSLLWERTVDGVKHSLKPKIRGGTFPYMQEGKDWGHSLQLTYDEALWITLEFAPELLSFIENKFTT